MLSWLPRRNARIEIEAEAEALIRDFGEAAYSEACRREHGASSRAIARDWGSVALAVARLIGKRTDVDPLVRLAMNAVLVPDREDAAAQAPIASWTYAAQAPIPSRPDARSGTDARHLRRDAHVPNPICRRGAESRTDNFEGSRDSGTGRVGGYRRRREHRVASSNGRSTHSRRHRSRGV